MTDLPVWVNKGELAKHWNVHANTIDRWRKRGLIPEPIKRDGEKSRCMWHRDVVLEIDRRWSLGLRRKPDGSWIHTDTEAGSGLPKL